MNSFLLVGLGGALGAMGRFGMTEAVARLWRHDFPLGTLLVNVVGSVLMGALMAALSRFAPGWSEDARLFLAVGILGGFTTFSSFSLESVRMIENGQFGAAASYVLLSVVICLAGLYLGALIVRIGGT